MIKIFIDDSGDSGFDFSKNGTSPYFILGALLCDKQNEDNLEIIVKDTLNALKEKYPYTDTFKATIYKDDKGIYNLNKANITGNSKIACRGISKNGIDKIVELEI